MLWHLNCAEKDWLAAVACGALSSVGESCCPTPAEVAKLDSFTRSLGVWLFDGVHEHSLNVQLLQNILSEARVWAGGRSARSVVVARLQLLLDLLQRYRD